MKKIIAAVILGIALLAYLAWPPASLYGLALAVEARDVAGVDQRIDIQEIRRSLAVQVVTTYFELSGKKANGLVGQIMLSGATTIADALLANLVTPDALIDLLGRGNVASALPRLANNMPVLSPALFHNVWRVLANSDYAIVRYHVRVPFDRPAADQFRFQLRLSRGTWRLIEVELPAQLRRQLAQSIIDHETQRTGSSRGP
jgi:DUF2939 family protein